MAEGRVVAILFAGPGGHPDAAAEEVVGRPLLAHWVGLLAEAGVAEARVVVPPGAGRIASCIAGAGRGPGPLVVEAREPGPGGPIAANLDLSDGADAVFLVRAHGFADADLGRMLAFHRGHGAPLTVLLHRAEAPGPGPRARLDDMKRLAGFGEDEPGDLAEAGVYLASPAALRELAEAGQEGAGPEVAARFVGRARGWPWAWYHVVVDSPEALERVRADAPAILADRLRPGRPAVFLDRDGTILEHVPYLADPAQVRVLPGVAEALRRLRAGGYARVVVTNQSAAGRGPITEALLHEIHEEMHRQLEARGAAVDAVYFCPDVPALDDLPDPEGARRKPGPGMLIAAAADLGLDLASSWMVGDLISDLLAGIRAGCRGSLLVGVGAAPAPEEAARGVPHRAVADLMAAADLILGHAGASEGAAPRA